MGFDAKLQMLLEARFIRILHVKNYVYRFKFLQVMEDWIVDNFFF